MDDSNESPAPSGAGNGALICSAERLNRSEDSGGSTRAQVQELLYGTNRAPLATIVPDGTYRTLSRIRWPDGSLSNKVNVARAKDAAIALCERGPPARNRASLHWRLKPSRRPSEARTARQVKAA
jgi:hypothetical protein